MLVEVVCEPTEDTEAGGDAGDGKHPLARGAGLGVESVKDSVGSAFLGARSIRKACGAMSISPGIAEKEGKFSSELRKMKR